MAELRHCAQLVTVDALLSFTKLFDLRSLFFTIMKEYIKHYCYLDYEAVIYVSTTIIS